MPATPWAVADAAMRQTRYLYGSVYRLFYVRSLLIAVAAHKAEVRA
jgi:hypothetical protein